MVRHRGRDLSRRGRADRRGQANRGRQDLRPDRSGRVPGDADAVRHAGDQGFSHSGTY